MPVIWIVVAAYVLAAGILMWCFLHAPNSMSHGIGFKCLAIAFSPGLVLVLLPVTTLFWWLYPERHVNQVNVYGTEEQKQVWEEYKDHLAQKPFWRRLAEKLGLAPHLDPPWPDQDWPQWPYEKSPPDKSHPA